MKLGDIRTQVNALAGADLTLLEVAQKVNRGLLDLAPALYLLDTFSLSWSVGVESYPAPANVYEFRRFALWVDPGGISARLNRVQADGQLPGWWYDGTQIGIRPVPTASGTFRLLYVRYPRLVTGQDPEEEPELGDVVGAALIQYCCADYYDSLGDEESRAQAAGFRNSYQRLANLIAAQRHRLMAASPSAVRSEV